MILIKIKDTYVASNPTIAANPNAFILHLGDDDFAIPSSSRNLGSIDSAVRTGSPYQINLKPYEEFGIDDTVFESLVDSAKQGGDTSFINRILHFVNVGVLEVRQDGGSPLTSKQVLAYTAP